MIDIDIARLRLAPGDVLVAKVAMNLRSSQMELLREEFAKCIPGWKVLIIGSEISLAVLTRAEIEARIDEAA